MKLKAIKSTQLSGYIGKQVRVVYAVEEIAPPGQTVISYGENITPPVTLQKFDPEKMEVTFQRANGLEETFRPNAVLIEEAD